MNSKNELLRGIPQVEKLLQDEDIACLISETGKPMAAEIIRENVEQFRTSIINGSIPELADLKRNIISGIKKRYRRNFKES